MPSSATLPNSVVSVFIRPCRPHMCCLPSTKSAHCQSGTAHCQSIQVMLFSGCKKLIVEAKRQGMDTTPDKPRHSLGALVLLVINLLLALILCFILGFVVPKFAKIFQDMCVRVPIFLQNLLNLSKALMRFHGVGLWLLTCAILALIIRMYLFRHRSGSRKALVIRLWFTLIVLVVLIGITIHALISPAFSAGDIMTVVDPPPATHKPAP